MSIYLYDHEYLARQAALRPTGYLEELRASGCVVGWGRRFAKIDTKHPAFVALSQKYSSHPDAERTKPRSTTAAPPPQPGVWGPPLWRVLHERPARWGGGDDSRWLGAFTGRVPCGDCADHWRKILAANPPTWDRGAEGYFAWTVLVHNLVNRRLGKAELTVEQALNRAVPFKQ